jgi:hypothetical protein
MQNDSKAGPITLTAFLVASASYPPFFSGRLIRKPPKQFDMLRLHQRNNALR